MITCKFGMELPEGRHPWQIAESLKWIRTCGYDFFEFSLTGFPLIVQGEVNKRYVDYLKPVFEQSGLQPTVHIGTGLDLRSSTNHSLHRKVLMASIEVSASLGASVLTVHFEQSSRRQNVEKNFWEAYQDAAVYAQEKNILLCMENIEIEDYRLVPELIDRIGSPNLRMTLDLGHLYLSTKYFGGDYMTAIDEVLPYVSHIHIHDNTGAFEPMRLLDFDRYRQMNLNERIAFGQGDIHLPPLWGTMPIPESLEHILSHDYTGSILLECGSDFYEPFYQNILEDLKTVIQKSCRKGPGEEDES